MSEISLKVATIEHFKSVDSERQALSTAATT